MEVGKREGKSGLQQPRYGVQQRELFHHWGSCQRFLPRVRDSLKATSSHQQMKKLWYIYTVECYSAIKRTHLRCSEVDEPRACYTEWSKSEREKQTLFINAYIWDLEKWYRWTHLMQGRNRDTDIEKGHADTEGWGRREWDGLGEQGWHTYTPMRGTDSWQEAAA